MTLFPDRDGPLPDPKSLLRPGETCWRVAEADKASFIIDAATFFSAAKAAMRKARRSILVLGWHFDPRTRLEPNAVTPVRLDTIGELLLGLKDRNPELDIRVLIWDMALHLSAGHGFYPRRARHLFHGRIKFHLDDTVPFGACHHQKLLVIDDEVAFCGGADFAPNRWDTDRHPDQNPSRVLPSGHAYPPRHDLVMLVNGPVARALGDLARERWRRATGEVLPARPAEGDATPWPDNLAADVGRVQVGIARTEPARRAYPAVRENERLYIEAIASARRLILLENQYLTSPRIANALAARLGEPDGPEIVLICTRHSPGLSDSLAMDIPRDALIAELRRADRFGRFHAYAPHTRGGKVIIVHSKVAIIDDRMLRIGSTNLNNRSLGYDTECDLAIEAENGPAGEQARQAIGRLRNGLIGHYLGRSEDRLAQVIERCGSIAGAIDTLDAGVSRRLQPFPHGGAGLIGSFIADLHLGDPNDVSDAWRPWLRESGPARALWTGASLMAICGGLLAYVLMRSDR